MTLVLPITLPPTGDSRNSHIRTQLFDIQNYLNSGSIGIVGTITNDSAATGDIGEYVESVVSAISYTSNVVTVITSISLTAGDWDVSGAIIGQGGSTNTNGPNYTFLSANSGTSTADIVIGDNAQYWAGSPAASTSAGGNVPLWRKSLSTTTTIYLKINSVFTGGTPTAWGKLCARRRR